MADHNFKIDELMKRIAELSGREIPKQIIVEKNHTQTAGPVSHECDINNLSKYFAMKTPPDNTIIRIEALEGRCKLLETN